MFKVSPYMGEVPVLTRYMLYFSKTQLEYVLSQINSGAHGIPDSFDKVKSGEIDYTIVLVSQPYEKYYKITYEPDQI